MTAPVDDERECVPLEYLGQAEAAQRYLRRFVSGGGFARPRLKRETDDACCCCGLSKCDENNDIVYCEGCDGAFHQLCYNIPVIPEGDFFCKMCAPETQEENDEAVLRRGLGDDDDDGRLGVVLESSGLGSCVDYFVVAALTDRLASPAVTLLDLATACVQKEHGFFQALCRRALTASDRWLSKLVKGLNDLGYVAESRWLGDDPSDIPSSLQATQRARLLRCAFEVGIEYNADLRNRVRAVFDSQQFDRIGVDGSGRSYYVFEDGQGSFALCRETTPRPLFVVRASSSSASDSSSSSAAAGKKKRKKEQQGSSSQSRQKRQETTTTTTTLSYPKKGKWETVATTTSQLLGIVGDLEKTTRKTAGFDLWLTHTLRDRLAGHIKQAKETAKIEAKKRERAARRTRAAQNNLSVAFSSNDEATTFAPDVNGLLFSVADGPRKSRRPVDYRFSDYDKQIQAATSRPQQIHQHLF